MELNQDFAQAAKKRFRHWGYVTIIEGNSGDLLGEIVAGLQDPILFWLDGHYSGGITAKGAEDTPILKELSAIFSTRGTKADLLLIDDARCFGSETNYPSLDDLRALAMKSGFSSFSVKDDIVRILK